MTGAICGGSPYVWKVEPEPERWCYGERKRRTGRFELRGMWPKDTIPTLDDGSPDPVMMWEPVWVYKCDGCNHDRRWMW
jgi:hypothetical protein